MWLYNPYIPSLHDELAHPRIWIGMPTLTMLSCQLRPTVVPMLEAQLFQYRICIDLTILTILTMYTAPTKFTQKETYIVFFPVLSMCMYPFRYHYIWAFSVSFWSFSVSFRSFSVSFRSFSVSFRFFLVLFSVYSYRSSLA